MAFFAWFIIYKISKNDYQDKLLLPMLQPVPVVPVSTNPIWHSFFRIYSDELSSFFQVLIKG